MNEINSLERLNGIDGISQERYWVDRGKFLVQKLFIPKKSRCKGKVDSAYERVRTVLS